MADSSEKNKNYDEQVYNELQQQKLEEQRTRIVQLSAKGKLEYQALQMGAAKQFGFWAFVGSVGGYVVSNFITSLGAAKTYSPVKKRRTQYMAFLTCFFGLSYHGYKISRFQFIKKKKVLLDDPENLESEPIDLSQSSSH